jgi:hypothetical protein
MNNRIYFSKETNPLFFPDLSDWHQTVEKSLEEWNKTYPISELTLVSGEPSDEIKAKCLQHYKLVTTVNDQEIILDQKWLLRVKDLNLPEEPDTLQRLRKVVDDSHNCRTSAFEVAEIFMDEWPIIEAALEAAKNPQETSFTDQELLDVIKMAFDLGKGQPKDDGPLTLEWPMRILRHVKAAKNSK